MTNPTKTQTPASADEVFSYRYPPFADTFEIQKPFQSTTEKLILSRAVTFIRQGKSLAIYGEAGAGKSMLLKSMISQLDTKTYRIAAIPYGGLKPSAILRELCESLAIDTSGRKTLLPRLQKDFQRTENKPFPVLIIDDAHTMENQSFIDLCSLLHDAKSRTAAASLILIGQSVLRKKLKLDIFAPVRTRLACQLKLDNLSIDEAKEFIQYRLEVAQAPENIFHEQALECIAADCGGNRRTIMNLSALCLEETAQRKEKVVTADIVNSVSQNLFL